MGSTDDEDGKLVKSEVDGVSVETAAVEGGSVAVFDLNVGATMGNLTDEEQKRWQRALAESERTVTQ